MIYEIRLSATAQRQFDKLEPILRQRIVRAIDRLAEQPRPAGNTKLIGSDLYRIRVWSYRILYDIYASQLRVLVLKIGHRREIYR